MRVIELPGDKQFVRALSFAPDGRTLFAVTGGLWPGTAAVRYDLATGTGVALPFPRRRHLADVDAVVVPGHEVVVIPSGYSDNPRLHRLGTGRRPYALDAGVAPARGWVSALAASPGGRWLAVARGESPGGRVLLWDLPALLRRPPPLLGTPPAAASLDAGEPLYRLAFDPGGGDVAGATMDGRVVRVSRGGPPSWAFRAARPAHPFSLAVGVGGRLALGRNQSVSLWADGRGEVGVLDLPATPTALAYHPSGRPLAVGREDGVLTLADPDTATVLAALDGGGMVSLGAVAFAPDGLTLAAAGDRGRVVLWDTDTL